MQRTYRKYFGTFLATLVLLASSSMFVKTQMDAKSQPNYTTSATPAVAHMVSMHTSNMAMVPVEKAKPFISSPPELPGLPDVSPSVYAQYKAAAAHNSNAPVASSVYTYNHNTSAGVQTPSLITSFQGMADSSSICPPSGCQVPDDAMAVSPNWVLQGVNTSFAVYNTSGALQPGWPKTSQSFFGVPALPNNCNPVQYLIDVRAFYDINDGRFWTAMYQAENAFGIGTTCPFQSLYWIAVSQTNDPNGTWNVYSFDMTNGTQNAADFTQFGFDTQAIYFSGNMYDRTTSAYQYPEIFSANKSLMENGKAVNAYGFFNLQFNGKAVDTVQPVENLAQNPSGPPVGLFVNSFNYNSGSFHCSGGCHGLVVWAMANPTSTTPTLSSVFVDTSTYALAPQADQTSCTQCIDTSQTEIMSPPVYHSGLFTFALDTATSNGTQTVPAIFWGQVSPVLNSQGVITSASISQSGYLSYQGDTAAAYGSLMSDANGDLFMVFDMMSSTMNPQVQYIARPVWYTPGLFPDGGNTLRVGDAPTIEHLWGDFDATSYDGFATDNIWMAGEYSPSNGSWATYIGEAHASFPPPPPTPTPTITFTPTASAYRTAVLNDQPTIYYRLDEASGTTANDSSGNGYNGTYTSNAVLNQSGATSDGDAAISGNGRCLQFSAGTGLPTGSSPFSVEIWFKTTATPSSPYGSSLVAWGTESGNKMFALKIYSSTKMKLTNWTNAYYFNVPNGANTLDGNWHYVVVTFDGSKATIYYDGQSLGTQTVSFNIVLSTAGLVLGSQTGKNDSPYNGFTDEMAIYNKVLSATQIQTHFSAAGGSIPTPTPTPTLTPSPTVTSTPGPSTYRTAVLNDQPTIYYRLDEASGTTANDSSGNGYNGTYTSNAVLNQSGATSDGDAAISGNGRCLQFSAGTGLPTGSSPFSVEIWFKTTATPSSPYGSTLIAWGTEGGNKMFALKIYSSTKMKLTNWTNAYYFNVPNGANTLDGNWHYVVATFDGSKATIYYDGQSLGTQTVSFNIVLSTAGLVLGSQTGKNDSPYNGFTDEMAIYNKVLSATQIQTHYNNR